MTDEIIDRVCTELAALKRENDQDLEAENARLRAQLAAIKREIEEATVVYGRGHDHFSKSDRWANSQWVNIHDGTPCSTYRARLVRIEKIK
jgi:ATP/maltotriose-dependent transcriptional regulator MalT